MFNPYNYSSLDLYVNFLKHKQCHLKKKLKNAFQDWLDDWGEENRVPELLIIIYPIAIAIIPAVFYTIILYIFNSHRLSFFIGIPLGIVVNLFSIKLIKVFKKLLFYILIAASGAIILTWVGYIIYYIFKFFRWIWYLFPN